MRLLPLLLGLMACPGDEKDDTASAVDDTGGGSGLPSLTDDLDTGGCEDWEGNQIPGSASYFYGEYEVTGTDDEGANLWSGEERWLLFANSTWEDQGGGDCEVAWTATATETEPSGCGSCEFGLEVTLTLDLVATTCDDDLSEGTEGDVTYVVDVADDGTATWYYASSGNTVGVGYYEDGAVNFLSDKQCDWF